MKTPRAILIACAATAALCLGVTASHAAASISFNDGVDPIVVVADGGLGDLNPTLGAVSASLNLGTWTINIATGLSKPVEGSATAPAMDFNSGVISSTAAGSLTILFSDTSFGPSTGAVSAHVGGNTTGTVTISAFADPGNALFATTTPLIAPFNVSGSAFSSSGFGSIAAGANYSITQEAVITLRGSGSAAFDYSLNIPEPSCLSLLTGGFGLLLAWGSLRRRAS